jgi:hypothetical protein
MKDRINIGDAYAKNSDFYRSEDILQQYTSHYYQYLRSLPTKHMSRECISGMNRLARYNLRSSSQLNIHVNVGDVCYMDFGQVYINEAGYQHFGLILSIVNHKAFVLPMTSNSTTYQFATDPTRIEHGKNHLIQLGWIEGLNKQSVAFINDCKFINTARIISIKGHINPDGEMFKEIVERVRDAIFP